MKEYEKRVREYEEQGLTRSDAQGVVDAEDLLKKDTYVKDYLRAIKQCDRDYEIAHLINKIYEDGFEDGVNSKE